MTPKEMKLLSKVCSTLDKLQVELCMGTPYPTPSTEEIRNRILKAMDYLEEMLPDYDDTLEEEQQRFDDDCYEALSSIGDMDF